MTTRDDVGKRTIGEDARDRERQLGERVRAVDDDDRVGGRALADERGDRRNGIDRTERVRDVIERDDARARTDERAQAIEVELTVTR